MSIKTIKSKSQMIQELIQEDNFPTDAEGNVVVSRDPVKGHLVIASDIVCVRTAPTPMFYYDQEEGGLDYADAKGQEWKTQKDHDFGECLVQEKSVQTHGGRCFVEVEPENPREFSRRDIVFAKDSNGNPSKDENGVVIPLRNAKGEILTKFTKKTETYLLVEIGQVEFLVDHEDAVELTQALPKKMRKKMNRNQRHLDAQASADNAKQKKGTMSYSAYQADLAKAVAEAAEEAVSSETADA